MDDASTPLQPAGDDTIAKELIEKEMRKKFQKQFNEQIQQEEIMRKRLKELGWAFLSGFVASTVFYGIYRAYQASHTNADQ